MGPSDNRAETAKLLSGKRRSISAEATRALLKRLDADIGGGLVKPTRSVYRMALLTVAAAASDRFGPAEQILRATKIERQIIVAIFVRIFHRLPEPPLVDEWLAHVHAGGSATDLITIWLSSDEYFQQRAHNSNALFSSIVLRDLMISDFVQAAADIEIRLNEGCDRSTLVAGTIRQAVNDGWLGRNIALRLGLEPELGAAVPIDGTEPDPLRKLFIALISSDAYVDSAASFASAAVAVAQKASNSLAGGARTGELAEAIAKDLVEREGPARAISQFIRRHDSFVESEVRNVIIPALAAFGVSLEAIDKAAIDLPRDAMRALRDGPLAPRLCGILDRFDETGIAAACSLLRYGDRLVEHWEQGIRPFIANIVDRWHVRIGGLRGPDTSYRSAFWTERLLSNEYYFAVLAEFLASSDAFGADPLVFYDGTLSIAPTAGSLVHFEADQPLKPVSAESRMRVATTFFYWYDTYYHRAMLSSPDTLEDADSLALTLQPPTLEDFSFLSFRWHRTQFDDLDAAKIDVVLPVFYGTPLSDPIQIHNPHDRARNVRNNHAEPGLRMIRRTIDGRADAGMRVGLFFDTTTLNLVNVKNLRIDFNLKVGMDWFYESIRSFFSHLPRSSWALRDGRPIILIYHPCFGLNAQPKIYPFVRHRFKADFGIDPFIVTASEEEAPRVIQNDFVTKIAAQFTYENWRDRLAHLLADDHLFESSRSDAPTYVDNLIECVLGQYGGVPSCQPKAVFAKPSGGSVSTYRITSEEANAIQALRTRLLSLINDSGRKQAVMVLLTSGEFIEWSIQDIMLRYLRKRKPEWTDVDQATVARLRAMLMQGEPFAECLKEVFLTDAFAAAAGGEDRVIDLVYQTLVWRCPNPDYVNNHTTIDDTGRKEFIEKQQASSKAEALKWFLERFEVAEAVASDWLFKYYRWYNPGIADSSFYWGGAIAPVIRDVAAVGPGYDQSAIRTRPTMVQPRHDGRRYREQLDWVAAMSPRPWLLHLETWNEFFEGTCICDCEGFGRQYIDATAAFAQRALKAVPDVDTPGASEKPLTSSQNIAGVGTTHMTDYAELFSSIGWHQRWEIAPGIFTPGGNNVADLMDWTNVPQSLAGKRVLDIGAWNGCFSFEAERRGAAEVIAIGPEHPDNTGFTKLKEFLGSKVQYRLGSIYHLQPDEIGVFDVVLCFGVLYHLRYPLLGIDMVRRVARGTLHLETYAMPGEGPSMWEFYRKNELNNDASNWFGPNKTAIEEMLLSSGFDRVSVKSHPNNRASAFAHVSAGKPEWFSIGCGEGFYYDVITKPVLGSPDSY